MNSALAALILGFCLASASATEFQGLDGRVFLFNGKPGAAFNLISEQFHQVNALFVDGPQRTSELAGGKDSPNGTYIASMGLKLYNTTLEVDVGEDGSMTVILEGEQVVLTNENNFESSMTSPKVNVTTHKFREELGETVHVVTDIYNFMLYASPRKWDEENKVINRGHLNMALGIRPEAYFTRDVHGVLGQIAPDSHPDVENLPKELQTAFLGDGEETDYVVSGLFGQDFKFNRFGVPSKPTATATLKLTTSRRHLREVGNFPQQAWHTVKIR